MTAKLRYAIDLLVTLAHHDPTVPLSLREVAGSSPTSEKYLETIAAELRRGGIVTSRKGKYGGYMLSRSAANVTILDILESCEPELLTVDGYHSEQAVDLKLWQEVTERMRQLLGEYRLADIVDGRLSHRQIHNYSI